MTDPVARIFADVFAQAARAARTDRVAQCLAGLAADCAAIETPETPSVGAAAPVVPPPAIGRGPGAASTVPLEIPR